MDQREADIADFRRSFRRTVHRCEQLLAPGVTVASLRGSEKPLFDYFGLSGLALSPADLRLVWRLLVNASVRPRAHAVEQEAPELDSASIGDRGRLMIFLPEVSLSEGLAVAESGGFFDADYCPPPETWLWHDNSGRESCLLAWVPRPFVGLADAGMSVGPAESIRWGDSPQRRRADSDSCAL